VFYVAYLIGCSCDSFVFCGLPLCETSTQDNACALFIIIQCVSALMWMLNTV